MNDSNDYVRVARSLENAPSQHLFALSMGDPDADDTWASIRELHRRSEVADLTTALRMACDAMPEARRAAADILGQIGYANPPGERFDDEAVTALITLLGDADDSVVSSAAHGLAHRRHAEGLPHLLPLLEHPADRVRYALAHSLGALDDRRATATLIALSNDRDRDVRDWATFALGSLSSDDTPELREALFVRLADDDAEVRGEAIAGLANRKDRRTLDAILGEIARDPEGVMAVVLGAAEVIGDPALLPALKKLDEGAVYDVDSYWRGCLDDALRACDPGIEPSV